MARPLELISGEENTLLAKITPPQSQDEGLGACPGAYCFVIDVSGSMNAAAQVTTEDGDKVNHGWSQLDIAKHSTNTFVASLGENDYVSVVTYSDNAKVLLEWTACDERGREAAIAKIHSMGPERSTNLTAGIATGFSQFEKLVGEPAANPAGYAMNLIVTTDGIPSSQWHPARGRDGYAPLVKNLSKTLGGKKGVTARPVITAIGIGMQLDSELLVSFSDTFLHMPDPGQIGPFTVNLLAACRSTARFGTAATFGAVLVSPASALDEADPVPGYDGLVQKVSAGGEAALRLPLGPVLVDQVRHIMLCRAAGSPPLTVTFLNHEEALATATSEEAQPADAAAHLLISEQKSRLRAIDMMKSLLAQAATPGSEAACAATVDSFLASINASAAASAAPTAALAKTLASEVKMGCTSENFPRWGAHYLRTLPLMLRAERRSNFRDECLGHFGKDAAGREALFEELSNAAEMTFATLTPPEPSLLRPPPTTAYGIPVASAASAPPPQRRALPDEFMRGGGCFGPDASVTVVDADGSLRACRAADVRAGMRLLTPDGTAARVACVVMTTCAGGRAELTRLAGGLEITQWHPVLDGNGAWRFPLMLGASVVKRTSHVYNFVTERRVPALLVNGVACAALGHGLDAPVVKHEYWGTDAVIDDLRNRPGWEDGRVVL